jgi:hypothetical protein
VLLKHFWRGMPCPIHTTLVGTVESTCWPNQRACDVLLRTRHSIG